MVSERWSKTHHFAGTQKLHEMIQQPYDLFKPGWADQYVVGMINQVAQAMDDFITSQVCMVHWVLFRQQSRVRIREPEGFTGQSPSLWILKFYEQKSSKISLHFCLFSLTILSIGHELFSYPLRWRITCLRCREKPLGLTSSPSTFSEAENMPFPPTTGACAVHFLPFLG